MAEPGPAHVDFYFILFYLFIIIYYNIKKNEKNSKKISKNPLKNICDFLKYFSTNFA
jgi:hypothetical protein